jgi:gamma-glutamyl hydrolase
VWEAFQISLQPEAARRSRMGIPVVCRLAVVLFLAQSILLQVGVVCGMRPIRLPSERKRPFDDDEIVLNSRPLIGILSQPGDGDGSRIINSRTSDPAHSNISYIAASYVKFVEAGGARVVPLIYNEPEEVLKQKFASINGILFPGGDASLKEGPFYRAAEKLFNWALEANDNGDYFPIYGVCLGYELLTVLVTKDHYVLEPFRANKKPAPLFFINEAAKGKSFFKWFSDDLIEKVSTENLALENHSWGLSPSKFAGLKPLTDFFEVLTITPDENDKMYVSTVQGRKYPVTAVQYHPEKNMFEWGYDTIPHSAAAGLLTQSVANFVIRLDPPQALLV